MAEVQGLIAQYKPQEAVNLLKGLYPNEWAQMSSRLSHLSHTDRCGHLSPWGEKPGIQQMGAGFFSDSGGFIALKTFSYLPHSNHLTNEIPHPLPFSLPGFGHYLARSPKAPACSASPVSATNTSFLYTLTTFGWSTAKAAMPSA